MRSKSCLEGLLARIRQKESITVIAAESDEMGLSRFVKPLQSPGHEPCLTLKTPPAPAVAVEIKLFNESLKARLEFYFERFRGTVKKERTTFANFTFGPDAASVLVDYAAADGERRGRFLPWRANRRRRLAGSG